MKLLRAIAYTWGCGHSFTDAVRAALLDMEITKLLGRVR